MNMIERVARAIWTMWGGNEGYESYDALPEGRKNTIRVYARAAIEAMREPTDEMIRRGTARDDGADETNAKGVYSAMINAALKS